MEFVVVILIFFSGCLSLIVLLAVYIKKYMIARSHTEKLLEVLKTASKILKKQELNLKTIDHYISIFEETSKKNGKLELPDYYWQTFRERKIKLYIDTIKGVPEKIDLKVNMLETYYKKEKS